MTEPQVRTPLSAYFLAAVSFVFVTGGIYFVFTGAILIFVRSMEGVPPLVLMALAYAAFLGGPLLGGLSAWQSLKLAREKARIKALAGMKPTRPCPGCGEAVEVSLPACPMCGKELPSA